MAEIREAARAMKKVIIYTAANCPYCHLAKELLRTKGAAFEEIDVTGSASLKADMTVKAGRSTVPQIWIGETHVGGCDDLHALERSGKLDGILAA
jgi:glutaredoxin 3